jgi:hypothetical protein
MKIFVLKSLFIGSFIILIGCSRGTPSENTPIHLNPNMDDQPKYEAMEESKFFLDKSSMRMPVEGTVARGELKENTVYYQGKHGDGTFVKKMPVDLSLTLLKHGQKRFNIYCTPCHGGTGAGNGIVVKKGFLAPQSYHIDRLRNIEDGYIFDVISNGIRNMPSYGYQIPVADRWAIVAYVRALQRSQNANINDIPENKNSGLSIIRDNTFFETCPDDRNCRIGGHTGRIFCRSFSILFLLFDRLYILVNGNPWRAFFYHAPSSDRC